MIILNIICKVMLISQDSFRVCKTIMSYIANFVNFIGKTCYTVKSIENLKISPGLEPRCAMCTLRLCCECIIFHSIIQMFMLLHTPSNKSHSDSISFCSLVACVSLIHWPVSPINFQPFFYSIICHLCVMISNDIWLFYSSCSPHISLGLHLGSG